MLYVTEELAQEQLLLDDARRAVLFVNDEPFSGDEGQTVWDTRINVSVGMARIGITTAQTPALIVGGALFLTMIVVAIVVALSSTESDKDVAVVVVVGAAHSLRRASSTARAASTRRAPRR